MKPPEQTMEPGRETANKLNLNLFWDLQSKDANTRLMASKELTTTLQAQQNQMAHDEISSELEYAFSRLIQGLGSDRKQVKVGFSTALTNLLINIPSSLMNAKRFFYLMNDQLPLSGKQSSKKILKEIYIGRLLCLLSLIKSRLLVRDGDWESMNATVESLLKLSRKKPNLKKLSYHAIHELIQQADSESFDNGIWTPLFPLFKTGWSDCSMEVVLLLITCCKHHPETCGRNFLRTFKWVGSKDSTIANKNSFPYLSQLIGKSTVCHPIIDVAVLDVLTYVAEQSTDVLVNFWSTALQGELLSTSPEKKYLAFNLALHILPFIPVEKVALIWSPELISCLHRVLANNHSSIHHLCRKSFANYLAKRMKEDNVSADVQFALLMQLYASFPDISSENAPFHQFIEFLVQNLKLEALKKYIVWLKNVFAKGHLFDSETADMDSVRIWSITQLAQLVKQTTLPRYEEWILDVVKFLFLYSYCSVNSTENTSLMKEDVSKKIVDVSTVVRKQAVQSFTSTLLILSNSDQLPANERLNGGTDSSQKNFNHGQMSSGEFWTSHILKYADSLISSQNMSLLLNSEDATQNAWNSARKHMKKLAKYKSSNSEMDLRVLELLLTNLTLQLLSNEDYVRKSTIDVLNDLQVIINDGGKKKRSTATLDSPHWLEVVVEIILSLLLSESRVLRSVVEHAFRMLCPYITKQSLRMILDVLESKDEKKLMDVQDDEEHVNGEGESDEDSDMDAGDEDEPSDQDVDEMFKSEVRQALGSAALPVEESDDVEDLDDEAMMKLDPMLSDIFKKKKKSDSQTTKKQMFEFQARCLMLIEIFLSRHYDNQYLVIELPIPLLRIIEQSSTDHRKANIAERATVILRAKLCRMKTLPRDLDNESLTSCHDNIAKLLTMAKSGNRGLFINQLISQCCLFYLRILTRQESFDSQSVCQLYSAVLDDFMTRRQSKIQHFILSDFVRTHPVISQHLVPDLIKYCGNAVQPYRRLQACMMLTTLCHSKNSSQHMVALSTTLLKRLKKILKAIVSNSNDVNSKYLVQLLRLFHFSVKTQQSMNKDRDWSKVIKILQDLLLLSVVDRSSSVTNHVWMVLQLLGVKRPPRVKEKKRKININEGNEVDEKTKESSRQLKQRIMKEKKKGAGKKLKITNENIKQSEETTT